MNADVEANSKRSKNPIITKAKIVKSRQLKKKSQRRKLHQPRRKRRPTHNRRIKRKLKNSSRKRSPSLRLMPRKNPLWSEIVIMNQKNEQQRSPKQLKSMKNWNLTMSNAPNAMLFYPSQIYLFIAYDVINNGTFYGFFVCFIHMFILRLQNGFWSDNFFWK